MSTAYPLCSIYKHLCMQKYTATHAQTITYKYMYAPVSYVFSYTTQTIHLPDFLQNYETMTRNLCTNMCINCTEIYHTLAFALEGGYIGFKVTD